MSSRVRDASPGTVTVDDGGWVRLYAARVASRAVNVVVFSCDRIAVALDFGWIGSAEREIA